MPEVSNQYDYDADITLMGAGELYRDNAVFLGWSEAPTALVEDVYKRQHLLKQSQK